jgi:hypothetical protein
MDGYESNGTLVGLVDIGNVEEELVSLVLRRSAAVDGLLAGHFVGPKGAILPTIAGGSTYSVSATISSTAKTFLSHLGLTAMPPGAVGFKGRVTLAPLAYCAGADLTSDLVTVIAAVKTDMENNPQSYPWIAQSDDNRLGRA